MDMEVEKSTSGKSSCHPVESPPPSHEDQLANLRRIEGQIRGISRMIEEQRYCMDILVQCRSVHRALEGVEKRIFRRFLDTCVRSAFSGDSDRELEPMLDEIVGLLSRK